MSIFIDARRGRLNASTLREYLVTDPDILNKQENGRTVLANAVRSGKISVVELLLNEGADVNLASYENMTPLMDAMVAADVVVMLVRLLLERGANVNVQGTDVLRQTPLMFAIGLENVELVKLLVDKGAVSNDQFTNFDGLTAVQMAAAISDAGKREAIQQAIEGTGRPSTGPTRPPPTPGSDLVARCLGAMVDFITDQKPGLSNFYDGDLANTLQPVAERGAKLASYIESLGGDGEFEETAAASSLLALYDLAILLDDSTSMKRDEGGRRIETLKNTLRVISRVFSLATEPGTGILAIRWFNSLQAAYNVTEENARSIVEEHKYGGLTRIGSTLQSRVLKPLVYDKNGTMTKPLLVMVITDGKVDGEENGTLERVIKDCIKYIKSAEFKSGPSAVAFQFSRIGNNEGAKQLLRRLDSFDEGTKAYVDSQDVTIDIDAALAQGTRSTRAVLTLMKLLIGAICPDWDEFELEGID